MDLELHRARRQRMEISRSQRGRIVKVLTPCAGGEPNEAAALVNSSYRGESSRRGWANEADYSLVVRMSVVHLRDTLIACYERRGYVQTGEIRPFPFSEPARDDLRLVVVQKDLRSPA